MIVIRLKFSRNNGRLTYRIALGLSVLPLLTAGLLYLITRLVYEADNKTIEIIALSMTFMLIACNIVVFMLFQYILIQNDKVNETAMQAEVSDMETAYYKNLSFRQEQSSRVLHDLKNKAFALEDMVRLGDPMALEKISEICEVIKDVQPKSYTGVAAVDYLLATKALDAKERGIKFTISSSLCDTPKTSAIDLCVILGNLIDNCIEACEQVEEKYINLKISKYEDYIKLFLSNSVANGDVRLSEKTSKKDKLLHGFGIANVKEIIEQQNGIYTAQKNAGEYVVNIMII